MNPSPSDPATVLHGLPRPHDPAFELEPARIAIARCVKRGEIDAVASYLAGLPAADIADLLSPLQQRSLGQALSVLDARARAAVFRYLPTRNQVDLVTRSDRSEIVRLFHDLPADERADLYNALPTGQRDSVLPALAQAEREEIRKLAAYREGTAGALMTSEYASLDAGHTASEALDELRRAAPDKETIYTAYVVDGQRRLVGVVSLRDIIVATPDALVSDLMETRVVHAGVLDAQKSVAQKIARYDLIALPVIDDDQCIVGIVTADDAMDVAAAESTASFRRVATVGGLANSLRDATVRLLYQKRVFWLVLLIFGNLFSGAGLAYFENVIATHIALVFFLPLLIDSGGNAGSQSATLMVRALATGDVRTSDWRRMLGREFLVALMLGVTMALAVWALGWLRGGVEIAMVISLTMLLVVMVGSVIGVSLPFLLDRFKMDPATASAPLITTIADGVGVLIYLNIAAMILPELAPPG